MAGQENILREYLAKLGFKVDDASYRRFTDSVVSATKTVLALGATVEGAALAIEALAVRYAASGDKMYWSSQRIGASAKNIQRFQYEISQLGGSAEGAKASLQAFSDFLRTYPGARQVGARLGIDPDKFKDTAEYAEALLSQLGKLSPAQQKLWGQLFGFDVDTLLAGARGMAKFRQEYDDTIRAVGLNQDDLGKKSTAFMQNVRRLELDAEVIGQKVFSDLLDRYGPKLDQFVASLSANLPLIAKRIEEVVGKILKLADSIERGVTAIGGWKTVFEGILAYVAGSWLIGMLGAIGKVRLAFGILPGAAAVPAAAETAAITAGASAGSAALVAGTAALATTAGMAYILSKFTDRPGAGSHPGMKWQSTGKSGRWVIGDAAEAAINYFTANGWTPEHASGIAGNLARESSFDPSAVGGRTRATPNGQWLGLGQWDATRQALFKSVFGHDLRSSTFAEQLQFVQYELTHGMSKAATALRGANSAAAAGTLFSQLYEMPGDKVGEATLRSQISANLFTAHLGGGGGKGDTHVANTINNTVTSSDPVAAGKAVGAATEHALNRVTARMFAPAAQ